MTMRDHLDIKEIYNYLDCDRSDAGSAELIERVEDHTGSCRECGKMLAKAELKYKLVNAVCKDDFSVFDMIALEDGIFDVTAEEIDAQVESMIAEGEIDIMSHLNIDGEKLKRDDKLNRRPVFEDGISQKAEKETGLERNNCSGTKIK